MEAKQFAQTRPENVFVSARNSPYAAPIVNDFINELICFDLPACARFVIRNTVIYEIACSLTSAPAHSETSFRPWKGMKSLDTRILSFLPFSQATSVQEKKIYIYNKYNVFIILSYYIDYSVASVKFAGIFTKNSKPILLKLSLILIRSCRWASVGEMKHGQYITG